MLGPLQPHFLTPRPGQLPPPTRSSSAGWGLQDVNPRRPAPFRAGRGLRAAATGAREVARTGPGRGCREVAGPPAPPPPSLTHGGPGSDLPRARRPSRSAPGPPPSRLAQLSARRAGVPASSPTPASPARASQVSAAARGGGRRPRGTGTRVARAGGRPRSPHPAAPPAGPRPPQTKRPRCEPRGPSPLPLPRPRPAPVAPAPWRGHWAPNPATGLSVSLDSWGSLLPRVRASRASPRAPASRPASLCVPVAAGAGRGLQGRSSRVARRAWLLWGLRAGHSPPVADGHKGRPEILGQGAGTCDF